MTSTTPYNTDDVDQNSIIFQDILIFELTIAISTPAQTTTMTVTIAQQDKFVDTVMIYHIHVDQHIVRIVCTLIILSVATQITPGHDLIMLSTWTSGLLEVFHRIAP